MMDPSDRIGARVAGVALVAVFAMSVSCVGFRGPADVKRDVERRTDSRLEREFAISLGPVAMAIARRFVEDEDVPLRGVRKVQVGVYHRSPDERASRLDRHLEPDDFPEFAPIVRVREDDERVLVLARMDGETMRTLLVVVDDLEEVAIVRLNGRLDDVVEQAIRMAFDEIDREDLTDPTVDAWRDSELAGDAHHGA